MSFKKVIRTTSARRGSDAHASFSITKRGLGTLRFNQKGMKFLREKRIKLLIGDRVDIYMDEETDILAILRTPDGEFRLGKNATKNKSIRLSSADLTRRINVNKEYDLQESREYDVIMVPKK